MKRPLLTISIAVFTALAMPAAAQDTATRVQEAIIAQLSSQGFTHVRISHTLLGRVRIVATAPGTSREIIFNPRTGEILRDYWDDEDEFSGGLISSSRGDGGDNGSSRGGSDRSTDDSGNDRDRKDDGASDSGDRSNDDGGNDRDARGDDRSSGADDNSDVGSQKDDREDKSDSGDDKGDDASDDKSDDDKSDDDKSDDDKNDDNEGDD